MVGHKFFCSCFQIPVLSDPTTPTPGEVLLPEYVEKEATQTALSSIPDQAMFENANTKTDQTESPDSGHKEMSSDSLAYNLSQPETNTWYAPMSKLSGSTAVGSSERSAANNSNISSGSSSQQNTSSFISFEHHTPKALAQFGAHHEQFSQRPLNTTGVNVHGQEFHLQLKTSISSSSPFTTRVSQSNPARSTTETSYTKTIITPAPSQDATGNKIELNVTDLVTPKLNPPPKISAKRNASRSPSFLSDSTTSPDSSNNNYSSQSSSTSENSLNGEKRHSRDSSRLSATDENLNKECKELNTLPRITKDPASKDTADRNMNNLSLSPKTKNTLITSSDSTTKLHLSFSDEENTENSEDSGVPPQPQTLDSMTFDEFEALASS